MNLEVNLEMNSHCQLAKIEFSLVKQLTWQTMTWKKSSESRASDWYCKSFIYQTNVSMH